MLFSNRNTLLDAASTSGRCRTGHAPGAGLLRRHWRPLHSPQAADVANPAMFPLEKDATPQQLPQLPLNNGSKPQQQQQQPSLRRRNLFGAQHNGDGGGSSSSSSDSNDRAGPAADRPSSSPPAAAADRVDAAAQPSAGASSSSFAGSSYDPDSSDSDSEDTLSQSSSSSSSRQGSHQQQQQQQQPQQPYHLRRESLRTVQWYRDQASRRLTTRIKQVQDLAGLRQVMRQYEGAMNQIHINALFGRLVKLVDQRQLRPKDMLALPALLPQVLSLVAAGVPDFDERSISNVLHGLAVLELEQERELLNSLLTAAEVLQLSSFKPQGLANMTWALAALHTHPGPRLTQKLLAASAAVMQQFKGVELAQLGWAVASLQVRVPEPWAVAWRAAVAKDLAGLSPQGMSMVLWAAARMADHQMPPMSPAPAAAAAAAAAALQQQQQQPLRQLSSQQPLPQSQSQQQQQPAGETDSSDLGSWLQAAQRAMGGKLYKYGPHSLSICLWSMARLGYRPPKTWTWQALEAVKHKLHTEANGSDLAVLLYSLAGLSYSPNRAWLNAHGAALRAKLPEVSVRQVSNMLWAYGKLGRLPAGKPVLPALLRVIFYGMQDTNARDLANSLWALATLGITPPRPWMSMFGAQAESLVHDFTPQEISNLLWSYAKLGQKPPHMLLVALWEGVGVGHSSSSFSSSGGGGSSSSTSMLGLGTGSGSSTAGSRLSAFKPLELSMLVWALATLRVAPGKEWWEQFLQASYHKMPQQSSQGLASIIWSLAELQLQPPPAWLYNWAAATRAALPAMNPIDLGQVASALQSQTLARLQLPKLEALLLDVLDRLAAVEVQSGAYSRAAMQLLMGIQPPAEAGAAAGGSAAAAVVGNGSGSSSSSVVRARRISSRPQPQPQQQQQQLRPSTEKSSNSAGSSNSSRSSSSSSDEMADVRAALESMTEYVVDDFDYDDEDADGAVTAAGPGVAQQLMIRLLQLQQNVLEAVGDSVEAGIDSYSLGLAAAVEAAADAGEQPAAGASGDDDSNADGAVIAGSSSSSSKRRHRSSRGSGGRTSAVPTPAAV